MSPQRALMRISCTYIFNTDYGNIMLEIHIDSDDKTSSNWEELLK